MTESSSTTGEQKPEAANDTTSVAASVVSQSSPTISGSLHHKLKKWRGFLPKIANFEETFMALSDPALRKQSLGVRYRIRAGEPKEAILPEAFALVREAGRRVLGMRHYDVQLLGGAAMSMGSIVEMQTGEGKTLTATLPLYLAALEAKGAHLATVNDYLAKRDAEWMEPVYKALGLSVGVIQTQMQQDEPPKSLRKRCHVWNGE